MTDGIISKLPFHSKGIVSIIGAGGKTTLMFQLAKMLHQQGKTVLTTTTTKIFFPTPLHCPKTIIEPDIDLLVQQIQSALRTTTHISAGSRLDKENNKLSGLAPETVDALWQTHLFDTILVEADGAAQKPVKASAPHEPVIPQTSTCLIIVTGLDGVGTPLDVHHVHRPEIFSKNTQLDLGEMITASAVARSILLELKKAKNVCASTTDSVMLLNKADLPERKKTAADIIKKLQQDHELALLAGKIIVTALQDPLWLENLIIHDTSISS